MSERLIIVTAGTGHVDTIVAMADSAEVLDCRVYAMDEQVLCQAVHLLVGDKNRQELLDKLQLILGSSEDWRITILPVEASIPLREEEPEQAKTGAKVTTGESREELYNEVASNACLDGNFLLFVVLSAVVAAIGLIEDNVAVVIGAMVIAPLLGPNLAFGLGVALGEQKLMGQAMLTNAVGLAITLGICLVIGAIWPVDLGSEQLMARTDVGFGEMTLALASGAAAALSLTTGLSSALVGVMVAVALLPPVAAVGLMLGSGHLNLATGAALLLAVNVVCVNLSTQVALVLRGVTPRTWLEKENARLAVMINAAFWLFLLVALAALMLVRPPIVS